MVYHFLLKVIVGIVCGFREPSPHQALTDDDIALHSNVVCDLTVDAGPDVVMCLPDVIQLMGTVSPDPLFVLWEPSTGLNDPTILDPTANITGTITYTLTGWDIDPGNPNIIVNGDFEDGNVGFSSDYLYVQDLPVVQDEMVPAGTYTVINNPFLVHEAWSPCMDHTSGTADQMMLINGELSLQDFWCQTVTVLPNTYYNIESWVSSVHPSSPAILQFSINGTPVGQIINAPSSTCEWIPFNALWYSGSITSAEICIINLNTTAFGNDFALDDISMVALCEVSDEVTIFLEPEPAPVPDITGPDEICENSIGTYSASLPPEPEVISYTWVITGGTITSGQGSPQVNVEWNDQAGGTVCLMIETACDDNQSCIDVIINQEPLSPSLSGPATLCPGETGTFYAETFEPGDEFNWIVPAAVNIISGQGTPELNVEWASTGEIEICLEVTNDCGTGNDCISLLLFEDYLSFFDTVLCEGQFIEINGTVYGSGNLEGVENFTSINGCDSIVEISIELAAALEFFSEVNLCPGDSIFLEGEYQSTEGIYVDSFLTSSGCDSILITEVTISLFDTTVINSFTCDPNAAGTFIETFTSGSCDSTVVTNVTLQNSDTTSIQLSSCIPADTGQTILMLTNLAGCDSIVFIHVLFKLSDTTRLFHTSCDPGDVGITTEALTNFNGCDSLVITTITFALSDTTYLSFPTCSYMDTGSTTILLTNTKGCDSLVIEEKFYGGSDTTFLVLQSCIPADTGWTHISLMNQNGCDSIISTFTNLLRSDSTFQTAKNCNPLDTGLVIQVFQNVSGCDSVVLIHTVLESPDLCFLAADFTIEQPLCFEDTAWLNAVIEIGTGPFTLMWENDGTNGTHIFSDAGTYRIPLQDAGETIIKFESANGLSIIDTVLINVPPLLSIEVQPDTSFGGYGVPCHGDKLGRVIVNILEGGTPPLSFEWSNGNKKDVLENIGAGNYSVSVTDKNGCIVVDSVMITEPAPLEYDVQVIEIPCYGESGGFIIDDIAGGTLPWQASLNGNEFTNTLSFANLSPGEYHMILKDANGCVAEDTFMLSEQNPWSLEIGPDTSVVFGSVITITPDISGVTLDSISIEWSDDKCENCQSRTFDVQSDLSLTVTATDKNGCKSSDVIHISVSVPEEITIPNVFSPNGDNVNDYFFISTNPFIEKIDELSIFDRWGNMVFQRFDFVPNEPSLGWNGKMQGQLFNPAVFAYKVIVHFKDGRKKVFHGDVTLVR